MWQNSIKHLEKNLDLLVLPLVRVQVKRWKKNFSMSFEWKAKRTSNYWIGQKNKRGLMDQVNHICTLSHIFKGPGEHKITLIVGVERIELSPHDPQPRILPLNYTP